MKKTYRYTVPSTADTFYIGACVDSVSDESDKGNNCSTAVLVTVREPGPDLTVSDISVSDENPDTDDVVKLEVTVQNRGSDPASTTTIRYYQSEDSTISASEDDFLASDAVPALSASATASMTLDFTVPSAAGPFYLGACIDSVSDESDRGNNCSTAVLVTAEDPDAAPDLTVSRISVSDATPAPSQTIRVTATVRNQGDGPATPTRMRYYRSNDSTINKEDRELVNFPLPAIPPKDTLTRTYRFTVPSTADTFYLGACVDTRADESDKDNNCSTAVLVTVE